MSTTHKGFLLVGLGSLTAAIVATVYLFVGAYAEDQPTSTRIIELCIIAFLLMWVPAMLEIRRSRTGFLSPIPLQALGYSIFFLWPALQIVADPGMDYQGLSDQFPEVLMLLIVGFVFLLIGYYISVGKGLGDKIRAWVPFARYNLESPNALIALLVVYGIGWAARFVLIYTDTYFHTVSTDFRFSDLGNLVGQVEWLCKLIFIFVLVRYLANPRAYAAKTTLLVVGGLELAYNVPSGGRQALIELLIFIVVAVGIMRQKMPRLFILGGVVIGLVVFPILADYRAIVQQDYNNGVRLDVPYYTQTLLSAAQDFVAGGIDNVQAGIQQTAQRNSNIVAVAAIVRDTPSTYDYLYGSSYFGIPFFFVPRVLWPDKPSLLTGVFVTQRYFPESDPYQAGVVAASLLGEFYMNFGSIGVFVGMLLYGLILRFMISISQPANTTAANLPYIVLYTFSSSYFLWISQTAGVVIVIFRMWLVIFAMTWLYSRFTAAPPVKEMSRDQHVLVK